MNIIVLFFGHIVCFTISTILRHIIKRYIGSKPPGHQSVLDLLILDIIFLQTFYYINFLIVLFTGLIGHIPFIISQIMLSFVMVPYVMSTCLSQLFIVCKAILVFRGVWLAELSDLSFKRITRVLAWVCTCLILYGNYYVEGAKPAVLTTFLTGTLDKT